MSPEFTDSARAALAWVLYHHQGGSSPVGQPIRFALGMGAHEPLTDSLIAEAKRWAAWAGATTADFHAALTPPAAAPTASCTWSQQEEGDDCYNTGCGHEYTVLGGEDGEVDIPYCPYCARRIEVGTTDDDLPAATPSVEDQP